MVQRKEIKVKGSRYIENFWCSAVSLPLPSFTTGYAINDLNDDL
jgi:hypothetical protein